jgi:acetyl-CoA carboxylase biotin carboxyl carrier protein
MGLTDDDVAEILRIIDESKVAELRVRTSGFELHVRRGVPEIEMEKEKEMETPPPAARSISTSISISSPMLGVFYIADAPGDPPFVSVGAQVEPETVVGIIEVMKMMNTVHAGISGTVAEVCVENAELVEEGQTLFRVTS